MLGDSHNRRKRHKLEFLKKHKNYAINAFRDAVRLRDKGQSLKTSENISNLVRMARSNLKYSEKTNSDDIFWALMKLHHEELEEKNGK